MTAYDVVIDNPIVIPLREDSGDLRKELNVEDCQCIARKCGPVYVFGSRTIFVVAP